MTQKVAVVTGGCSGIGKCIVDVLISQNYNVVILSRSNTENLNNVIICDVSKKQDVENAFIQIQQKYSKIDVLVNSAGFGSIGALELVGEDLIKASYETNVFGTIYVIQQALKLMSAGGKIFNIASMQALAPVPFKSMYSSSKAAVASLSYCLSMELKKAKISVCCICPGDIKTNFTKNRIGVIETNKNYGSDIEDCIKWQDSREDKRSDVSVVAKAFKKQLKKQKCNVLVITPYKYKVVNFYRKIVSTNTYLKSIYKLFIKK